MKKLYCYLLTLMCVTAVICGCSSQKSTESSSADVTESSSADVNEQTSVIISAPEDKEYIFPDNAPVFSLEDSFYNAHLSIELKTAYDAEIYYTEDGSEPDKSDTLYTEPIFYECEVTDFPTAHTIKAKAFYADGTESATSVHTYFTAAGTNEHFSEYVFSVSGEPSELTESPDGIFYGENYEARGRESEREVYLSAWDNNGKQVMGQYCGVRIYGGGSRMNSIKSMKLFARKSYSSGDGKFVTSIFNTEVQDGSGNTVGEYDKLVLRNGGNDFQFAFIRDELCHTLAAEAGFSDYEAVKPAVCYLNGEYYGLFWLHETYCDDYFKEKYPNEAALGKFVIAEGTDTEKDVDETDEDSVHSVEFNEMYEKYSAADLTDDTVYDELCSLMDVENYLDYFAFNIYINNKDWPQNNFRCYRYCPLDGESAGEGVYDGKWRFLLHDMDYSMGMYEQPELLANYNNLGHILKKGDERYSPLFAALLEREDCRTYFSDKIYELADGVLDGENIKSALASLNGTRYFEQMKFYRHLNSLRSKGDSSIWTNASHLTEQLNIINSFAEKREKFMLSYLDECLEKYEQDNSQTPTEE